MDHATDALNAIQPLQIVVGLIQGLIQGAIALLPKMLAALVIALLSGLLSWRTGALASRLLRRFRARCHSQGAAPIAA